MINKEDLTIYTDGSSLGNPGRGGFAYLIIDNKDNDVILGGKGYETATNNQMELMGFQVCLEELLKIEDSKDVVINLDSQYVKNGISSWIENWKKNGWQTANKKPVLNKEIWQKIDEVYKQVIQKHKIELKYVKAHVGIFGNEVVDTLAKKLAGNKETFVYKGKIEELKLIYK